MFSAKPVPNVGKSASLLSANKIKSGQTALISSVSDDFISRVYWFERIRINIQYISRHRMMLNLKKAALTSFWWFAVEINSSYEGKLYKAKIPPGDWRSEGILGSWLSFQRLLIQQFGNIYNLGGHYWLASKLRLRIYFFFRSRRRSARSFGYGPEYDSYFSA